MQNLRPTDRYSETGKNGPETLSQRQRGRRIPRYAAAVGTTQVDGERSPRVLLWFKCLFMLMLMLLDICIRDMVRYRLLLTTEQQPRPWSSLDTGAHLSVFSTPTALTKPEVRNSIEWISQLPSPSHILGAPSYPWCPITTSGPSQLVAHHSTQSPSRIFSD